MRVRRRMLAPRDFQVVAVVRSELVSWSVMRIACLSHDLVLRDKARGRAGFRVKAVHSSYGGSEAPPYEDKRALLNFCPHAADNVVHGDVADGALGAIYHCQAAQVVLVE